MQAVDWLWILHPALAVVVVFPLIGMVLRLGWLTRRRRLQAARQPPTVGREHADLGQWLAAAVVLLVLLALTVVIATKAPPAGFAGGAPRALQLLFVLLGTLLSLLALWRVRGKAYRLCFALLTWIGVLGLGGQPEVWRVSDDPLSAGFWSSHYWAGASVVGLMLFALGARPEIGREPRWRRLHLGASVLAGVLFVVLGITGTRDLLEIPPRWQQPALAGCDFSRLLCPAPPPPLPPAAAPIEVAPPPPLP